MGLSGLGVASAYSAFGHGRWQDFVAFMLYPVGFIAVIIGRAQLFTENTLYPVALLLETGRGWINTGRIWSVVLTGNILGAILFAGLAIKLHAADDVIARNLTQLGIEGANHRFWTVFAGAIVGGWLIALVAWLVEGATATIGQVVIIWMLTFQVGVGHFAHSIASSGEILASVWNGDVRVGAYCAWLAAAVLGNAVGGVFFVALLNYGQVHLDHGPE